ncbi:hypothetical protein, partial [Pseudophaeobacter leonis]|uniref:hypothetical protein n=1 Tax=Pseudophaeobacter leonis TaxID=1144477 RepID=UPI0019D33EC0
RQCRQAGRLPVVCNLRTSDNGHSWSGFAAMLLLEQMPAFRRLRQYQTPEEKFETCVAASRGLYRTKKN